MAFSAYQILLLAAMALPSCQISFDSARHCPDSGPTARCHCSASVIECHNRSLSAVPSFRSTGWEFRLLDLENNTISSLPDRVFVNTNVTEIDLRDNNISHIHPGAFATLNQQLRVLNLRGNQLTVLPDMISKMIKLNSLDLSYNPIPHAKYLNDIMREIGDFLTEFRFGDPKLQEWPDTLHHLAELQVLQFYEGRFDRIPIGAFAGFEWTLRKLWIQNSRLISTPIALQQLHSLSELYFDNNILVKDAGVLTPAFAGLSDKLIVLSLENNSLTTFPPVLLSLNKLTDLSLAGNDLQFISDAAVSNVGSNLTSLNLQNCNLDRIPGALSKLYQLVNLDFSYNKVSTIEKNDLQQMFNLQSLNISFNPLQYVSSGTFHDLVALKELVLQDSLLRNVPQAVMNIPSLRLLDLLSSNGPTVECNCDLGWLFCHTQNTSPNLEVTGDCETIVMTIKEYAEQRVRDVCHPQC